MVLGKLDSNMQKNEPEPLSFTKHRNKLKEIKDLNVRLEIIKILQESTGSNPSDIGQRHIFLDMPLEAREI